VCDVIIVMGFSSSAAGIGGGRVSSVDLRGELLRPPAQPPHIIIIVIIIIIIMFGYCKAQ